MSAAVLRTMSDADDLCGACNDEENPVTGFHCCKAKHSGRRLHSHILCEHVWMPGIGGRRGRGLWVV